MGQVLFFGIFFEKDRTLMPLNNYDERKFRLSFEDFFSKYDQIFSQ